MYWCGEKGGHQAQNAVGRGVTSKGVGATMYKAIQLCPSLKRDSHFKFPYHLTLQNHEKIRAQIPLFFVR
jgi:hypothetical protein